MTDAWSIVKRLMKSSEEGIKLHIDDGCLGGGGVNGNFVKSREGIFSWCTLMDEELEPNAPYYTPYSRHISIMDFGFEMQANMESPNTIMNCLMSNIVLHSVCEEDGDGDGLNILGEMVYGTDDGNSDSDGDGLPDGLEVQLVKNPDNPNDVFGLELTISVEFDNSEDFEINGQEYIGWTLMHNFIEGLKKESSRLFDATDGHMYIKKLTILPAPLRDDCDMKIFRSLQSLRDHVEDQERAGACSTIGGFYMDNGYICINIKHAVGFIDDGFWTHEEVVGTITHEIGHYVFSLKDEYEQKALPKADCEENKWTESHSSIMDYSVASEFCTPLTHHEGTLQGDNSCWETI